MVIRTAQLPYEADGLSMIGHLAWDDSVSGERPAVLVFPEAFGLDNHARGRAERIASELGYVSLACDLHGNARVIDSLEEVIPLLEPLRSSAAQVRERTNSPLAALAARPEVDRTRIAAIGFCFGGTMSFELALSGADIKAAIGFHSSLEVTSPEDSRAIKGKIMALIGADDPGITPDQRMSFQEMLREGGVDWQMHLFGGVVHSFTNPQADSRGMPEFLRYDKTADARSWKQMVALLEEVFH